MNVSIRWTMRSGFVATVLLLVMALMVVVAPITALSNDRSMDHGMHQMRGGVMMTPGGPDGHGGMGGPRGHGEGHHVLMIALMILTATLAAASLVLSILAFRRSKTPSVVAIPEVSDAIDSEDTSEKPDEETKT